MGVSDPTSLPPFQVAKKAMPPGRVTHSDMLAAVPIVLAFAACDFAIAPAMRRISPHDWAALFVYAMFGAIGAQGCLLAIWSVVGPGSLWKRRIAEIAIGALWISAWAWGYLVATDYHANYRSRNEVWLALSVPLIYLAGQISLWIVRIFFHWRIESTESTIFSRGPRHLSLAEIMLFTATASLAFGAARMVEQGARFGPFWLALAGASAIIAGFCLVTILPTLALTLGLRKLYLGIAILTAYATVALLIFTTVSCGLFGQRHQNVFFSIPPTLAGLLLALCVPLLVARALGYRLAWGRVPIAETAIPDFPYLPPVPYPTAITEGLKNLG